MLDTQVQGIVFNIQKFSVHDGVGIRTLVFLKGCPLRCRWCSNPESQKATPEHAFNPTRCLTAKVCGRCLNVCTTGALSLVNELICFDSRKCQQCFACVRACPSGAESAYGECMSVEQVLSKVEQDGVFYNRSGGGMTLSGGEALMQHEFALALLREARHRHINTCIETCGHYPYEHLHTACMYLDKLIFDIKSLNPARHKEWIGVDNARILENFARVCEDFPQLPIRVRTPVIPGFNDTDDDIQAIREFVPRRPNIEYELLAYHRMGQPKYAYLGRPYALEGIVLDEGRLERLKILAR
ncbi:MAG: glycyl-radical enzyme activating protein [Desulfovibrio sp.]|nr:glycyl-radical enzyme activating protein [Desulfovibrio sp.]